MGFITDSEHQIGKVGYGYRAYFHDQIDFQRISWQQFEESPLEDLDQDNVADFVDNCPNLSNPSQADSDQDGIGDRCELVGIRDQHADNFIEGWTAYGDREWIEENDQVSPAHQTTTSGFLINDYLNRDDGILEVEITGDQWNGFHGGVVFRWNDPNSFYGISVKPGNQWTSYIQFHKDSFSTPGTIIASPINIDITFKLKIELQGDTFDFYLDDQYVGQIVDTSYPSGQTGYGYGNYFHDKIDFNHFSWGEVDPTQAEQHQSGVGGLHYVHTDHLGTPHYLTDQQGNIVWQARYNPFGQAQVDEDPDNNGQLVHYNLRFPGQYYDKETGLHYNWHRYYDPETGRYITADPIGLEGGINLYDYVGGNPINWVDFKGLSPSIYTSSAFPLVNVSDGLSYLEGARHYFGGRGQNLDVPFDAIDNGYGVENFISPCTYKLGVYNINREKVVDLYKFSTLFSTAGPGQVNFILIGLLSVDINCNGQKRWFFNGLIHVKQNSFDFDPKPKNPRPFLKESVTIITHSLLKFGKKFMVNFPGNRKVREKGTCFRRL